MIVLLLAAVAYVLFIAQREKFLPNEGAGQKFARVLSCVADKFRRILAQNIGNAHRSNLSKSRMSKEEAAAVLGVSNDASDEEINKAFRRLMMLNHPDKGGTKYLANKIIEAKKLLIG